MRTLSAALDRVVEMREQAPPRNLGAAGQQLAAADSEAVRSLLVLATERLSSGAAMPLCRRHTSAVQQLSRDYYHLPPWRRGRQHFHGTAWCDSLQHRGLATPCRHRAR